MVLGSFSLTVETYIPNGEFALEDYQRLCSASRDEERGQKELVDSTKNRKTNWWGCDLESLPESGLLLP